MAGRPMRTKLGDGCRMAQSQLRKQKLAPSSRMKQNLQDDPRPG
jgi:hypothetical protein